MDFLRESSAVAWEADASSLQLLTVHPGEPWQARISQWMKDEAFVSCCRSVEAGGATRVEF
ncbi:MAG: hypothetical protein WBV82_04385, partial [Myxococcaceae bacterium]